MHELLTPSTISFLFFGLAVFLVVKTVFNVLISFRNQKKSTGSLETNNQHVVELIRPLAFVKLFASCLTVSFFPQYLMRLTLLSHMPASFSSMIFSVYQVFFILMIVPSGYLVEFKNLKKILTITTFIECVVLFLFGFVTNVWEILLLQIVIGCIIPLSSSAEYAYIFNFSSDKNRTHSVSLYSNSIKGAMVAGIIIGGLLASHIHVRSVFLISGIIVFFCFLYALVFIPKFTGKKITIANSRIESVGFKFVLKKIPYALQNISFLKTILCVGFSLGILTEGVVYFTLPLVLSRHHVSHTVIAQLLVLFAIGFFVTNRYIAKKSDQLSAERLFLFIGLIGFSLGLFLIAGLDLHLFSQKFHANVGMILFVIGLIVLGLSRGFLISPAIAYISKSSVTNVIGKNVALSVYRLFEVFGKIIGPILVLQLLIFMHYSSAAFCITAFLFLFFALIMMPFMKEKQ